MRGGRRGGRGNFFGSGDPFGGFGGFGGHGSLISSVFGGRDPFDDPFFTRPFGGGPLGGVFESGLFGFPGSPFSDASAGFLEHHQPMPQAHTQPQPNRQRGPIIEELDSDDEKEEDGTAGGKDNPRKHGRSENEPYVEHPDDDAEERGNRQIQLRNDPNGMNNMLSSQTKSQCFTFHSSTVSYGGANGAYYTKSSTRRSGSDGLIFEEHKEADSKTGRAFHQVSRGLHNKGHTLARNLKSDGRVDSRQTLHNLNEDELAGFDEAWKGKARKHLPGVSGRLTNVGAIGGGREEHTSRGGWALPSTDQPQQNVKRARMKESGSRGKGRA